jgi:hypothetical protein
VFWFLVFHSTLIPILIPSSLIPIRSDLYNSLRSDLICITRSDQI